MLDAVFNRIFITSEGSIFIFQSEEQKMFLWNPAGKDSLFSLQS